MTGRYTLLLLQRKAYFFSSWAASAYRGSAQDCLPQKPKFLHRMRLQKSLSKVYSSSSQTMVNCNLLFAIHYMEDGSIETYTVVMLNEHWKASRCGCPIILNYILIPNTFVGSGSETCSLLWQPVFKAVHIICLAVYWLSPERVLEFLRTKASGDPKCSVRMSEGSHAQSSLLEKSGREGVGIEIEEKRDNCIGLIVVDHEITNKKEVGRRGDMSHPKRKKVLESTVLEKVIRVILKLLPIFHFEAEASLKYAEAEDLKKIRKFCENASQLQVLVFELQLEERSEPSVWEVKAADGISPVHRG
ncbi:hypothetical protein HPP92_022619 [Vanilla planifolia]|uniref:Uncharacterized protein n=1 Tax=Vanilla planifolia TaxID=51239 RepID=A0A835UDD2_VANPL|nr:hypothetical protein HPP92_022619 [Vanilla planifolia]